MKTRLALVLVCGSMPLSAGASDWRLAGTLVSERSASAMVDFEGEQTRVIVGDSVGGCVVSEIQSRQIVLACGDRTRRLILRRGAATQSVWRASDDATYLTLARSWVDDIGKDRQRLVSQIDLIPDIGDDGRIEAWRVLSVASDGELAELGLHAGDEITAVNRVAVADPSFMDTLRQAPEQGLINLRLNRNQQEIELNYTLQ